MGSKFRIGSKLSRRGWIAVGVVAVVLMAVGVVLWVTKFNSKIPGEKRMARILADVYTIDAVLQYDSQLGKGIRVAEDSYHTILSRYGLTKSEYDSAIVWYSNHPEKYSAVYERVVAILTGREADFKQYMERRDSIEKRIKFVNDSVKVSLGKWPKFIRMPLNEKDTLLRHARPDSKEMKNLDLAFDLVGHKGGKVKFVSRYSFPEGRPQNDTLRTVLRVEYSDGAVDSTENVLANKKTLSANDLTVLVDSVRTVRSVRLRIESQISLQESKLLLQDMSLTYMPYEIPDSAANEIKCPSLFAY